jgi:hypothetical protein
MSSAPSAIASVTDSIRETFKSLQHSAYHAIAARMRAIVTDNPASACLAGDPGEDERDVVFRVARE